MKIPRIKKILYATDLSQNARFAFGYAVSLARQYKAGITILHVLEELSPTALLMVGDIIGEKRWSALKTEKEDSVLDSIKSRLEAFCEEFSAEMPDCPFVIDKTIVENGQPVDLIIQHAEKNDYDLVVMGSRGLGMLANAMLGSTSRRVLRRCRKPVLVIRLPEEVEE